jgi:hypothetical protein
MSDSGRRSWGSQQTGKWLGKRGQANAEPAAGLSSPSHTWITNGQPTLPLRVKIVTGVERRASRDCGEQAVTWSVGSRRNNHSRSCEAFASRVRTHLALGKDAPLVRSVQQFGFIAARPILGGLHHEYCRT